MSRAADTTVIRPYQEGDIEALLAGIREADLAELHASTTQTPLAALHESVARSDVLWVGEQEGEVLALFGVATINLLPHVGSPWLIGTRALDKNPRVLVAFSAPYIQHMLGLYKHLLNYVDARNVKSIRWLRRYGFTIHPPEPHGPFNLPFHRFDKGF